MHRLTRLVGLVAIATVLAASGTYRPPKVPKGMKFDKKTIKAGQLLFEKTPFAGKELRTCASCHSKGRSHPLKRGSLKQKKTQLYAQVLACVTRKDRVGGKKIAPGSKEAFQLGAYIVGRYRLPYSQLDAFVEKSTKDE